MNIRLRSTLAFLAFSGLTLGSGMLTAGCRSKENAAIEAEAAKDAAATAELEKMTDEQLVRKMLDLTGAGNLGKQVMDAMLANIGADPSLPPGFMEHFKQNAHPEGLVDIVVPLYLKHFNRKEMIAAIRFYQTPEGQKIIKEMPVLMAEAMQAGQRWGVELVQKTMSDLKNAPVVPAAPTAPATP